MTTFLVRKDGSGTHTTIQSAIYQAVNGDIIDVGPGTFYENVEITNKNFTLQGAGKDVTVIQGKMANDVITCSWFAGDSILTATSTSAAIVGKTVSSISYLPVTKIAEVISGTQLRVETATPTTGNYTKTIAAYQTVAFSVAPTSGTFKLRYNGVDSAAINWNDSAATIQTRLRAITGLSTVVVSGTIASKLLTIAFDGVAVPVLPLSANSNTLAPSVVITPTLIDGLVSGSSSIVLPNTTSVAVGHKVEGTGVNATITAWNSTTRTATLSSPITQTGSGVLLSFRLNRTAIAVTQTNNYGSSGFGSIMMNGSTNGVVIKDLTAIGFDGPVGTEASAIFFTASTSPGHTNFLIENCKFTADGDAAMMCGSNPYMNNGVIQNCIFNGKTFTGSEPADVPSFGTMVANGVVKTIGASTSVVTFSDMRGILNGRQFTSNGFAGTAQISAISGNDVTFNKVVTSGSVGSTIACTFTGTAYFVSNCARNLVYIGQNITPCNTQNITFKNNVINGQTGAVISATGSIEMFNSAVTIESVGGLVEGNLIDGNFGAGINSLVSNYAIRCRQSGIVVKNNTNLVTGGRGNSQFYVTLGTTENNITIDQLFVTPIQLSSGQSVDTSIEKGQLKAISKVANSATFSQESNWKYVTCIYKHDSSSKRLFSSFNDLTKSRPMKLKSGMASGQKYELHKIIISTANRTLLVIKRSEIPNASSYDFTLK